jgi:hypothetical protein
VEQDMPNGNKIDLQIAAIRAAAEKENRDKAERLRLISEQLDLLRGEITGSKHLADLAITAAMASGSLLVSRNGQRLGQWWTKDNLLEFTEGTRQDVLISATNASDATSKFVEYLARHGFLK